MAAKRRWLSKIWHRPSCDEGQGVAFRREKNRRALEKAGKLRIERLPAEQHTTVVADYSAPATLGLC